MIIVKLFMKGSAKMIDFSEYECNINVILLKALEYDRGQFEKGFDCGYKRAIDDVISKCSKEYQVWSNDSVCKIWLSDLVELKVKHEKGQGTEL